MNEIQQKCERTEGGGRREKGGWRVEEGGWRNERERRMEGGRKKTKEEKSQFNWAEL